MPSDGPSDLKDARPKSNGGKWDYSSYLGLIFLIVMVGGIPLFLWKTCTGTSPLRDETHAFFAELRQNKLEDAYIRLAESRRAGLSYEAFVAAVEQAPALSQQTADDIAATKSVDDEWGCTRGDLTVGDDDWSFEIYLVMEGDRWRVHTWALHPPALMTPLPLMRRCGHW